ncbi:hypothetical protein [Nocardia sp. NPDC005825]|uniref:hypothetical protein n=1 Tax=unclassified Nocardia TaxID=2637762 RepID=UPI0033CD7487
MTAIISGHGHAATDSTRTRDGFRRVTARFTRIAALFAGAGRAVPFHRERGWEFAGSSAAVDRDRDRMALELQAISAYRRIS